MCALLTKPERRRVELSPRYVGFEIPDRFVVGYGLDYAERYRNLPYVAVLTPERGRSPAAFHRMSTCISRRSRLLRSDVP